MNQSHQPLAGFAMSVICLTLMAGCRDGGEKVKEIAPVSDARKTPEQARMALGQLGKDYSPHDFVVTAAKGDLTAVKLFLDAGMSVKATSSTGLTALHNAALTGQEQVAALLIQQGAEVDAVDSTKVTPLMCAALNGHTVVVNLLLAKGARVNAVDVYRRSALWMAADAQTENTAVVAALLRGGANVNIGEQNGWTSLARARERKHADIIALLELASAKSEVPK
jgi:ankyrin repeat protein